MWVSTLGSSCLHGEHVSWQSQLPSPWACFTVDFSYRHSANSVLPRCDVEHENIRSPCCFQPKPVASAFTWLLSSFHFRRRRFSRSPGCMQLGTGGMWKRMLHSSETGRSIQVLNPALVTHTIAVVYVCFHYTIILTHHLLRIALKILWSRRCMSCLGYITQKTWFPTYPRSSQALNFP